MAIKSGWRFFRKKGRKELHLLASMKQRRLAHRLWLPRTVLGELLAGFLNSRKWRSNLARLSSNALYRSLESCGSAQNRLTLNYELPNALVISIGPYSFAGHLLLVDQRIKSVPLHGNSGFHREQVVIVCGCNLSTAQIHNGRGTCAFLLVTYGWSLKDG